MTPHDYDYPQALEDRSGLVLGRQAYLLESRLTPIVRKAGFATLTELVAKLESNNERLIVAPPVDCRT